LRLRRPHPRAPGPRHPLERHRVRAALRQGEPQASLTAPEFELFRVLSGRRSRRQAAGFEWTGDPEPYLDALSIFGPLPDTDVVD